MLTGPALGKAIEEAMRRKGVSRSAMARDFGVRPESTYDWTKHGRIAKNRLTQLFEYFADVVPPSHWGIQAGAFGFAPASQSPGLDPDILGIALTSMDQVIRRRGLRMERHLGKFAPVLAFAYELAREAFPAGVPDPEKAEGKKALQAFDKQLDEFLGGGIADGSLGPFEADAGAGSGSTGTRTAQRKKAGSGRG